MNRVALIAAAPLAALAISPAAHAKPASSAKFELAISGSQVTVWDYVKQQQPSCDWPEQEHGEQTITFETPRHMKGKVTVTVAKNGALTFRPGKLVVLSTGVIDSDYRRLFSQQSSCGDDGSYGGDGPAQDAVGSEHCDVDGGMYVRLGSSRDAIYDAGDPLRDATPGAAAAKAGTVLFRAEPYWTVPGSSYPILPGSCSLLQSSNAALGITDSRGEYGGGLVEASVKLPLKKLLRGRGRVVKVAGDTRVAYPNAKQRMPGADRTTGSTQLAFNLTFKRIGKAR